jgi:hypothetical protein
MRATKVVMLAMVRNTEIRKAKTGEDIIEGDGRKLIPACPVRV